MASTARAKVFFSESMLSALGSDPALELTQMLPADFSRWHALNRAQYLEAKLLLPGSLLASQGDRMLMANSVEGRFPFLDPDVIQLSTQIDPRLSMRGLDEKYLLKHAFAHELPAAITRRKKQPYRAPALDLLLKAGRSSELARELLSPRLLEAYGYFDSKKVQMLLRKSAENAPLGESDSMAFNTVLTAQYLHYRFITRPDDATSTTPKDRDPAISRRPRAAA